MGLGFESIFKSKEEFMDWLNSNSGAITGLSTAVLVIVTVVYVVLTWCILRATQKPKIVIYLCPDEAHINHAMLCIENIGTGPARDVRFKADPCSIPNLDLPLEEVGVFKKGIAYFEPGGKRHYFLVSVIGKLDELKQTPFKITVTYKGFMTLKRKHVFFLDFGELENVTHGGSPLIEISKAIQGVKKVLDCLASGQSKPTILTEPKSKYELRKTARSLEKSIDGFPQEVQGEILREIAAVIRKKKQEVREN